ncbi:MAG: cytochrome C [Campylobacterales bacterium]|nr:cytochrome C [Campylobacterales bacterium]
MKKTLVALLACSALSLANETTINATMQLMHQGMNQINTGFMLNSKEDIKQGLSTVENANEIFTHVDVAAFIKSNKVTVAKNINENLTAELKSFRKAVDASQYTEATNEYAKVLNQCVACHTIIRGW